MSTKKPSQERINDILEAAIRCFARSGYDRTKMDDIVRESGLTKGGIYWYFKSKREIFLALLDRHTTDDVSFWNARMSEYPERSMEAIFNDVVRNMDEHMKSHWLVPLMQEMAAEALRDEELREKLYSRIMSGLGATRDLFAKILAGLPSVSVTPENMAVIDLAFMWGLMMLYRLSGNTLDYKSLIRDTFILMAGGTGEGGTPPAGTPGKSAGKKGRTQGGRS